MFFFLLFLAVYVLFLLRASCWGFANVGWRRSVVVVDMAVCWPLPGGGNILMCVHAGRGYKAPFANQTVLLTGFCIGGGRKG